MSQRMIWMIAAVQCGLLVAWPVHAEETAPSLDALFATVAPSAEETPGEPAEVKPTHLSMEFQGTKLSTVLKAFSKQAGINIIAGTDVSDRPITIYLEDVTVLDALDQILRAGDLTYERPSGSDIYIVKTQPVAAATSKPITRVYRLRYARIGETIFARAAATLNESTPIEAAAQSGAASVTPALKEKGQGIDAVIKTLLTDQGILVADPRTNSLIVTDAPENFPRIEAALAALDVKTAQIMVDAELIETTLTKLKDLGIEWGSGTEGTLFQLTPAKHFTRFPFGFPRDWAKNNQDAATDLTTAQLGVIDASQALMVLQALEVDTDSKILARPKILTLDNESALIRLTTDETTGFTSSSQATTGNATSTPERTTTGVMLGVTPQINDGGFITMVLEPSVTKTVLSKISPPSGQAATRDPKTRGAHTVVRVRSGDTLVVGGLIDRGDDHSLRRVPILSGIPVFGEAFKNDEISSSASELIVFVTPRILNEPTASQVASAGPAVGGAREQEPGSASRQDLIEQTLNRLEQPSL